MKKQKVIMLKGLPASGKTAWAKQFVSENPNFIRVNKDDIRKMFGYARDKENLVVATSKLIIREALDSNYSIIVDDTNFNPVHENWIKTTIEFLNSALYSIDFEVKTFDTPVIECMDRDDKRIEGRVGRKVIMDMYQKYLMKPIKDANV